METLELSLLLIAAVLASSVVSQFLPRVSTPIVQIAMGLCIALFAAGQVTIPLDPELFLVLFIAPLLYNEARNADLGALWKYRGPVLAYAIGLVLVIVAAVGFMVNLIIPAVPLAAALALGAALGPTDAVAVASLSKNPGIPARVKSVLKGEALLNDAAGLVSFQFAVAFAITGTFSPADAAAGFAISFFGGIFCGAFLGVLSNVLIAKVRDMGLENTTFHVLLELTIPFLVFLTAEHFSASGIIAVVLCGLFNSAAPRQTNPTASRTSIVSTSVWKVLDFSLNGIVFVMLGAQLPSSFIHAMESLDYSNVNLLLFVAAITLVLEASRFIWSFILQAIETKRNGKRITAQDAKEALILTLSGAKGTITLSIMFSLPYYLDATAGTAFPSRDLLIFLASGVILCTFLIATFAVPLLAPQPKKEASEEQVHEQDIEAYMDILRFVIEELTDRQTTETARATRVVVGAYNDRIARIKDHNDLDDEKNYALRSRAIALEEKLVFDAIYLGETDAAIGYRYLNRLARRRRSMKEGGTSAFFENMRKLRMLLSATIHHVLQHLPVVQPSQRQAAYRDLQIRCKQKVVEQLEQDMSEIDEPTEDIVNTVAEYRKDILRLQASLPSITVIAKTADKADDIERIAYRIELATIKEYLDDGKLSRPFAMRMRENVSLMQMDLEDRI